MVDFPVPVDVREHFDVDYDFIEHLNGECTDWAGMDSDALEHALVAQGPDWYCLVKERCPHLFAPAPVFISELQLQQMKGVIAAVEELVGLPGLKSPLGVFYGYDFHLIACRVLHLIEINSNAGGGFLNAMLADSQRESSLYGSPVADQDIEQTFIRMFRNEWRLSQGDLPLRTIVIVDEQPESQYLYPEFLLAKSMFERAGIAASIVDPSAMQEREDGLYCNGMRVDMIYNRLTDFDLNRYPHIRSCWKMQLVVLTPDPAHYKRYADKCKLAQFSNAEWLRSAAVSQASIDALIKGVPETRLVHSQDAEHWWADRKQWFFKPVSGYGGKGAYRGEKLTKRVFEEIMQSDYVAQKLTLPGERKVCVTGAEPQLLKYDVRCYVYDGHIQLIAARLYQGQTTNFRTSGGGFALVREIR